MDPAHEIPENKVMGCVSQVWVHAEYNDDKETVKFEGNSDS